MNFTIFADQWLPIAGIPKSPWIAQNIFTIDGAEGGDFRTYVIDLYFQQVLFSNTTDTSFDGDQRNRFVFGLITVISVRVRGCSPSKRITALSEGKLPLSKTKVESL